MIALHRPGRSPLHRMPAGAKLIALAVLALAVSLWPHTVATAAGSLLGVFALYLVGGQGPGGIARQLWAAKWIIVLVAGSQLLFGTWHAAVIVTVRVLAVLLLAGLVTIVTRMSDLLDALERALSPLRALRLSPERMAFAISLTIAAIPVISALAAQVGEAHRARGIRYGPRAIGALLVLALRHADDVGDAIAARGGL